LNSVKIKSQDFQIAGINISLGETKTINLPIARTYDFSNMSMTVRVVRGKSKGPTLFLSSGIHGDEVNGVEIIRQILHHSSLKKMNGTLIVVPIVNVFGFNSQSRYLPDRRDLNRCFPGSSNGSLASHLAYIFMKEVVKKCSHGIDLHTAAQHKSNLPQIRACLDDPETKLLAKCFGAPVVIDSAIRDGYLREAARRRKIPTLLFEGGEALRFDKNVTKVAVNGILSVMAKIGMLEWKSSAARIVPKVAKSSVWIRASQSGAHRLVKTLGESVHKGDVVGIISDPFGDHTVKIRSQDTGIIVGINQIPLVNRGDALFHVATFKTKLKSELQKDFFEFDNERDSFKL